MRKEKKIVVEIDEKGDCSIDGQGFSGAECDFFMAEIEDALAGEITTNEKKPEYEQTRKIVNRNKQLGGR